MDLEATKAALNIALLQRTMIVINFDRDFI